MASKVLKQDDALRTAMEEARELVTRAIAILDAVNAPSDIAAHLDLAVHRMNPSAAHLTDTD